LGVSVVWVVLIFPFGKPFGVCFWDAQYLIAASNSFFFQPFL
jgi:hypothetical protein